jgi:hypothetical protein
MAEHHQPAWRLRDRTPGDDGALADPGDRTLDGLREVGFRAGGHGRFVWTVDERCAPFSESQRLGDGTEAAHVAAP